MKKIKNIVKRAFYGRVKDVGVIKGIGFKPNDEYYIDEHTYLFGFKLKTVRYWKLEDFENKIKSDSKRVIIVGFKMKKEV